MNNLDNEIPKYLKKKPSSTSKSGAKSKHKHEYEECLLICNNRPYWATVCKICGKINDLHFSETEKVEGHPYYRALDDNEVYEKYNGLEKYYIEDIWQKFVPVTEN